MRALSLRQATNCENATHKRCRCRCGGRYHGANRVAPDSDRKAFEQLPAEDPHKLPAERRRRPPALPQEELAL